MPTRPPRIFVADDQRDVVESLRLLLKGEGYAAETVANPDGLVADFSVVLQCAVVIHVKNVGADGVVQADHTETRVIFSADGAESRSSMSIHGGRNRIAHLVETKYRAVAVFTGNNGRIA